MSRLGNQRKLITFSITHGELKYFEFLDNSLNLERFNWSNFDSWNDLIIRKLQEIFYSVLYIFFLAQYDNLMKRARNLWWSLAVSCTVGLSPNFGWLIKPKMPLHYYAPQETKQSHIFLTLLFNKNHFMKLFFESKLDTVHWRSTFVQLQLIYLFLFNNKATNDVFHKSQHQNGVLVFLRWGWVKCES